MSDDVIHSIRGKSPTFLDQGTKFNSCCTCVGVSKLNNFKVLDYLGDFLFGWKSYSLACAFLSMLQWISQCLEWIHQCQDEVINAWGEFISGFILPWWICMGRFFHCLGQIYIARASEFALPRAFLSFFGVNLYCLGKFTLLRVFIFFAWGVFITIGMFSYLSKCFLINSG